MTINKLIEHFSTTEDSELTVFWTNDESERMVLCSNNKREYFIMCHNKESYFTEEDLCNYKNSQVESIEINAYWNFGRQK